MERQSKELEEVEEGVRRRRADNERNGLLYERLQEECVSGIKEEGELFA